LWQKKQKDNLSRVIDALTETYPDLKERRLLIVDDEADYASIGFRGPAKELMELRTTMAQINELRNKLAKSDFLQVTATPYSLYLQPDEI